MTDTPTPNPQKAGFRTSEFWLSTIATLAGILLASGALTEGGTAAQITGGILAVLASLGYTASRTSLKQQDRQ
jgi:hypothetical protein